MPTTTVYSAAVIHAQVQALKIEVDIQPGLPSLRILGLSARQAVEMRIRLRSAFKNSGLLFPLGRIIINFDLELKNEINYLDLAIAVALVQLNKKIVRVNSNIWVFGVFSLKGEVKSPPLIELLLLEAGQRKIKCFTSLEGIKLKEKVELCEVKSLSELPYLLANPVFKTYRPKISLPKQTDSTYKVDSIVGQEMAKRVLEIALAGRHNLLLSGPPGIGKTMLVEAAHQLLPRLETDELKQVSSLYIQTGQVYSGEYPPLRVPHNKLSVQELYGNHQLKPGELSLAHTGILFLDEFLNTKREVRQALLQPLQDKKVTLLKQGQEVNYTAETIVIAAFNPCPCGMLGTLGEKCSCSPAVLEKYRSGLTQPLVERFDLCLSIPKVEYSDWQKQAAPQGAQMAERIKRVRSMPLQTVHLNEGGKVYLEKVTSQSYISIRSLESILRVATTISRLANAGIVELEHLQEAVQYRYRPLKL